MQDPQHALFNEKTIQRMCSGITISSKQQEAANQWLRLLKDQLLIAEKSNYFKFANYVLQDILGYPVISELKFEEDKVEFSFRNNSGIKGVCIEVKGTATKDLFSFQYRDKVEHGTPIKQTWDYMGSGNFDYGICTNYDTFVLIDRSKGYSRYHVFNFREIENNDAKLKEFIAIFSKEDVLDKQFIPLLFQESELQEHEFTKQFYKLYHETRLMLIKEFQDNPDVSKLEAIHYAQLFLNRLIFVLFSEDTGKIKKRLLTESVLASLNPLLVSEFSRYVSDTVMSLFERLDKGSERPIQIFGFNGGLFKERIPTKIFFSDLRKELFFDEVLQYSTLKTEIQLDSISEQVIVKFSPNLNL